MKQARKTSTIPMGNGRYYVLMAILTMAFFALFAPCLKRKS